MDKFQPIDELIGLSDEEFAHRIADTSAQLKVVQKENKARLRDLKKKNEKRENDIDGVLDALLDEKRSREHICPFCQQHIRKSDQEVHQDTLHPAEVAARDAAWEERSRKMYEEFAQRRANQQEQQTNSKSSRARQREIIKEGKPILAQKHHPDHGGDARLMAEINAAATELEQLAEGAEAA
jgi:hypothetical protein